MKKISILLFAAASIFAVASCERDELTEPVQALAGDGETTTITLAFDDTKTALVDGKTTWVAGDKVRIYSEKGTTYQDVEVPESAAGKAAAEVEVNMKSDVYYAVYPVESANGISSDKVSVKLPNNPDGRFASANICVAEVKKGTTLNFHNVTSVLKVTVTSGNVVEILQINSKNVLNGTFTVGYDGEGAPELTGTSTSRSATVAIGGIDGDYYVPVAPGNYESEFAVTALRGNGGYQTIKSSRENTLVVNTMYNLGVIGNDLSTGLSGEGTEENPYIISNLGEYNAFASSVNLGNSYSGKFVKLNEDLSDIQTNIGYYIAADEQYPFAGTFDGNNHKIAVNLSGDNLKSVNYVAAFGLVDAGATVKNLVVEGTVETTGNYAGGVIGYSRGESADNRVTIENVKNCARVEGAITVAGISAYGGFTDIVNCENSGEIKGQINIAGICGYSYQSRFEKNSNSGAITGTADGGKSLTLSNGSHQMTYLDGSAGESYNNVPTRGVGGIAGYAQNTDFVECSNFGDVSGISKLGGISGAIYWGSTKDCTNSGNISGKQDYVGGIFGWNYTQGSHAGDTNSGSVSGRTAVGGIAGMTNGGISYAKIAISNCKNTGSVTSESGFGVKFYNYNHGNTSAAGGIVGLACEYYNGSERWVEISNCTNDGYIKGASHSVGGIVGLRATPQNNPRSGFIANCVNNGTVESSLYRAGGIIGLCFDRFENSGFEIRNCANHGMVKAPYVVAGIVSWTSSAYPVSRTAEDATIRILNCYNDGDILYDKGAYVEGKGPYAGGIVGYNQKVTIYNVFNGGKVMPVEGAPNEYDAQLLGSVVSFLGKYSFFDYLYSSYTDVNILALNGGLPVGEYGEYISKVKADGFLEMDLEIANTKHDTPEGALNEWVKSVKKEPAKYYGWKKGPEFDI